MRVPMFLAALAAALPAAAFADAAQSVVGPMQAMKTGADVYRHVCQGCHMPDGKGAVGAGARFPAFAGNAKLASGSYPVSVLLNGYGGMPWFGEDLTDAQIADVVNYIRTHFGNHYTDAVKPGDVAEQRTDLKEEQE